jgi:hypothetical protein
VISGSPVHGQTLRFSSAWSVPGTAWGYAWRRSTDGGATWTNIAGATGAAYTLASADIGTRIDVVVTSSNAYGSVSSTSAAVGPIG